MINVELLWYMLLPVFMAGSLFLILPRLSNQTTLLDSAKLAGIFLVASLLVLAIAFYAGKGVKTHDTEIWNGEVVSKERVHGSYVETYQCNCRTVTTGSGNNQSSTTVCDTCYRDHYTVHWGCHSNVRDFTIAAEDWTNSGVYLLPDPARYTLIKKGDPVAAEKSYTNYIKAVPETLFRPLSASMRAQYAPSIPAYPINVYDFYHVDRVLGVGVSIPDVRYWNAKLSDTLKRLGPQKQANVVIVVTKLDPNYFYALQDAWLNGKKNDIVVVIGAPNFPSKAEWVNVMALSQDATFQVKLRDDILALNELRADDVINTIEQETTASFKRKHMRDFAYLDAEIDPPGWVMGITVGLIFTGFGVLLWFVYQQRRGYGYSSSFNRRNRRF